MTPDFSNHPLIADRMAKLRAETCPPQEFRQHVADISRLLVLPATAGFASKDVAVTTPLTEMTGQVIARPIILVPILRAGLGMSDAFSLLLPEATVAHYGVARDEETLEPTVYLDRIPENIDDAEVLVLDPMLATGGSAAAALATLKEKGAQQLHFVCLVASPEGLAHLATSHPDVSITAATIDDGLNDQGYIVPGLGDAGDRIFGTL